MNYCIKEKNGKSILESKNGINNFLAFATLLLLVLSQNKDWGSTSFLWWGAVGLFMVTVVLSNNLKFYLDVGYTTWVVSFLLICFFSLMWAVDTTPVINSLKNLLVHFTILILLRSSIRTREDIETVFKVIVLSVVINSAYLLFISSSVLEQAKMVESGAARLGEEGAWNANGIGFMTSNAVLISLFFFKKTKKNYVKLINICIIVLTCVVTLLTGSRTAILKVAAGLALFTYFSYNGKRFKAVLIILILLIVLYCVMMYVPLFYSIIGWRMEGLFAMFTGVGEIESSADIRDKFIGDAIERWKERPILGYGLDCYRRVNTIKQNYYSHNNFVELLADLGVVGFIAFYIAHIKNLFILFKFKKDDSMKWFLITAIIVVLLSDYGTISYHNLLTMSLIMLSFAYITICKREEQKYDIENQSDV